MSAAYHPQEPPQPVRRPQRAKPASVERLQARRREARRRKELLRQDIGAAVLVTVVLLIVSPGLAVSGIVAALVLAGFGVTAIVRWRLGVRRERRQTSARERGRTGRADTR